MKNRLTGAAMIAAASLLAFSSVATENEEIAQKVNNQVTESHLKPANRVSVTLIEPIDGDTIKVRINGKSEPIRYLLVDTPESKNPRTCVQFYAEEAFLRNRELVESGKLTLEYEDGNLRDSYGRLLAYVFVDGESVQGTLLKEGYAKVAYIIHPPYKYLKQFKEDERLAKRGKLNIWSRGGFVTNWGFSGCLEE